MKRGLFLTFEGPDGSGKSTQIRLLCDDLRRRGFDVFLTREPGGTRIGETIRDLILDPANGEMAPMAEALLYAASRAQHVEEAIRPALERGRTVICDRFMDSSIVYQGYGRALGEPVRIVNEIAVAGLVPDLTFLLLVEPETSRERLRSGPLDRLEQESNAYYTAVYEGYLALAARYPERIRTIDGAMDREAIRIRIREELDIFLAQSEGGA